MKSYCSKCGKELKNGNVCISVKNRLDICSKCGMREALETRGCKNPEEVLNEIPLDDERSKDGKI